MPITETIDEGVATLVMAKPPVNALDIADAYELADRLDVSRQAVNAIETGKYDPSLPLAFKLARLFEMPIEDIFDDGFAGQE